MVRDQISLACFLPLTNVISDKGPDQLRAFTVFGDHTECLIHKHTALN